MVITAVSTWSDRQTDMSPTFKFLQSGRKRQELFEEAVCHRLAVGGRRHTRYVA